MNKIHKMSKIDFILVNFPGLRICFIVYLKALTQ